ncbi:MAG: hypothetical protein J1F31_05415 [Erysipelotrichales bacterium]|nr:hypothetical protein [Erysipelotrichales bacterium]
MKKRIIALLSLSIVVGLAILLVGIFVHATDIVYAILISMGIITIITNILNIVSTKGKKTFELINSLIGIVLGILIVVFPYNFLSIIIAIYFIVIPLLNMFYFKNFITEQDIIKLIFGILFFVFAPFVFGLANAVVKVFLIIIGTIIIIGAIIGFIMLFKYRNLFIKETKKNENVTHKGIDFDFSDKK